jgi:hypothetical protein
MRLRSAHRCLLCGDKKIEVTVEGRFVTTVCSACSSVLRIEFDPPEQPELLARIERIVEPDYDESSRVAGPESVTSRGEVVAFDPGRRILRTFDN